ncbi:MAG TPA: META domain-containing protein [Acidimicrobiia bacterium]|nr:META domain-containing protein [Acidimicrobiia bacterium]
MGIWTSGRALVALIALTAGACASSEMTIEDTGGPISDEIVGTWELQSFTVDAVEHEVEVGVNTASRPILTFGEFVEGEVGCNSITGGDNGYQVSGSHLTFDSPVIEASACVPDDLMEVEFALVNGALWAEIPIEVSITSDEMSWLVKGEAYEFTRQTGG